MSKLDEVDGSEVEAYLRDFLEMQPLYAPKRFTIMRMEVRPTERRFWPASVMFECATCAQTTTWTRISSSLVDDKGPVPFQLTPEDFFLVYGCARCRKMVRAFWCSLGISDTYEMTVRKVGQSPPWSITVPQPVAAALPQDAAMYYKKGLICMSQGFGLGAVAYFRRVVEEVVGHLLDLIEAAAKIDPSNIDQAALDAVASARESHQASDRLKLVVNQVPAHLRPGGANPLAKLYEVYSEGVHHLSDDESMDVALQMRGSLDYLLPALNQHLQAAREFQETMSKVKRRRPARA